MSEEGTEWMQGEQYRVHGWVQEEQCGCQARGAGRSRACAGGLGQRRAEMQAEKT